MVDEPEPDDQAVGAVGRGVVREIESMAIAVMVATVVFAVVPLPFEVALRDAIDVVGFVPAAACCVLVLVFRRHLVNGTTRRARQVRRWCNLLLAVDLALVGALLLVALAAR